jgi:hypothetical protein
MSEPEEGKVWESGSRSPPRWATLTGLVALAVLAIILALLFSRAANPPETGLHGGQSTSPLQALLPAATSMSELYA